MAFDFLFRRTRRRTEMHEMMERLRVMPTVLAASGESENAIEACADCESKEACRRWLNSTLLASSAPGFCPNAGRFKRATPARLGG